MVGYYGCVRSNDGGLSAKQAELQTVMIDATYLTA